MARCPSLRSRAVLGRCTGKKVGAFYAAGLVNVGAVHIDHDDILGLEGGHQRTEVVDLFAVDLEDRVAIGEGGLAERAVKIDALDLDAAADDPLDRRLDDVHHAREKECEREEMCRLERPDVGSDHKKDRQDADASKAVE